VDRVTVMIIDEQAYFRAGVRQVLSQEPGFEVLDCDPKQDPFQAIDDHLPDVALVGSDLAALSKFELGKKISRYYPNTKVIMLSPNPDDEEIFEIIKTSAVACLSKNTSSEELVGTIRRAYRGEYPINESLMNRPGIARHVLNQFQNVLSVGKQIESVVAPLTYRETQILKYIAEGNTNKQIANILGSSEQTIKTHVSAILRKLNANDRAHAVALAMRNGWISAEEKSREVRT